jgi:signal transduction histidine kinase
MVHEVVTRPLARLAGYARALGQTGLGLAPPDMTHASRRSDEFTDLSNAFEEMRLALSKSYAELQESELRYRGLFTDSPVSLWEEDFSAVKSALDALRPTVSDLAAHLDANPTLAAEMAQLVKVLDVNEATLTLHRAISRQDLLTALPATFTASSFRAFRRELLAIWHSEHTLVMDGEVQTLDGEPRQVVVRWNVPPPYRESMARVIVSLEDVTDRKAAERALTITVEKLMQANSELERITFVAAHHLQEPVRTVVSFSQLLERHLGARLDNQTAEYVGYLILAARRMQEQVRGLLDYSRAGQASGNFSPVDLNAALAAARETLSSAIAESKAEITVEPLPTIRGDFSLLSLMLRHLVGNAIKFRRPGAPPCIEIAAERQDTAWHLSVADQGIGFDPAFAANLFQVFGRLHGPADYPGAGIGLAICRRIVEMHGGRIWSTSAPGEGATFHFTLPAE